MTTKIQNTKTQVKRGTKAATMRVQDGNHTLVYEQALKDFPYPNLQATGASSEPARKFEDFVWSKEFVFSPNELLKELFGSQKRFANQRFEGWALIDLWDDDGELKIEAACDVARNGDWAKGRILPEWKMIWGAYDQATRRWNFWISR